MPVTQKQWPMSTPHVILLVSYRMLPNSYKHMPSQRVSNIWLNCTYQMIKLELNYMWSGPWPLFLCYRHVNILCMFYHRTFC